MNKLLLLVSLIAVDGWNTSSMLIAQTQSDVKSSPSATASAVTEDENKPQVLKTSPSRTFRVVQSGDDFWIVTAADEKQRTKMHSAELVIPEEFRFSPDEKPMRPPPVKAAFSPAEKERRRLQFLIDVWRVEAEADEEAAARK